MTNPVMEDSQTHANIIGAVSHDSKISLAGKCGREAKHIGSAKSTSRQPYTGPRDRKIRNILSILQIFAISSCNFI